ncbi:MAG: hypothetical protein JSR54_16170 [Proteobacteria bacterium]|nr:hypothetical protein [Pseudomonadota bacterium]
MAGLRTVNEERVVLGGLVFAAWLASLVVVGLLLSRKPQAAPGAPRPVLTVEPEATLPPTVVVSPRTDAHRPDCGRPAAGGASDRRCVFTDRDGAWSAPEVPGTTPERAERGPLQ